MSNPDIHVDLEVAGKVFLWNSWFFSLFSESEIMTYFSGWCISSSVVFLLSGSFVDFLVDDHIRDRSTNKIHTLGRERPIHGRNRSLTTNFRLWWVGSWWVSWLNGHLRQDTHRSTNGWRSTINLVNSQSVVTASETVSVLEDRCWTSRSSHFFGDGLVPSLFFGTPFRHSRRCTSFAEIYWISTVTIVWISWTTSLFIMSRVTRWSFSGVKIMIQIIYEVVCGIFCVKN